LGENVY